MPVAKKKKEEKRKEISKTRNEIKFQMHLFLSDCEFSHQAHHNKTFGLKSMSEVEPMECGAIQFLRNSDEGTCVSVKIRPK